MVTVSLRTLAKGFIPLQLLARDGSMFRRSERAIVSENANPVAVTIDLPIPEQRALGHVFYSVSGRF
jgi:hypothetical protein